MQWLEEHQVALLLFASLGLKFAIYYLVKIAIKVVPVLFCCRARFEWITEGKQWAVVTGATDGIGYEFARQLALKGYNLMLISRNQYKLEQIRLRILTNLTANEPKTRSISQSSVANIDLNIQLPSEPVEIRTLAVDFSHLYIYKKVQQFLALEQNDIFVLVNNVGVAPSMPDRFVGEDSVSHQEIVNVNIVAPNKMMELVLPGMVKRKRGLVVNMASLSGKHLCPLMSTYSASKAYVAHLSECLAEEYRSDGLTFCTLYPSSVSTKLTQYSRIGYMTPSAEDYVFSALDTIIYRNSVHTTGYWSHSLVDSILNLVSNILSRETTARLMKSNIERYRKHVTELKKWNANPENESKDVNFWKVLS